MRALSLSTDSTVTPFHVWPTFTVLGSPPSSTTTAALPPITPTSETSAAAARPQANHRRSAIILGMEPVVVIRTARSEGPAYFASYLERRSIAWDLLPIDESAAVPRDPRHFSGIALMGGAMSVNDDLPWIGQVLELIREAVRKDVPVLGHCLGAQLMSRAFGGSVRANPYKEIGWGDVRVCDNGVARAWLGELQSFETFQWHGETFSIPPGATRVLENAHCANQAFAIGKHFAMQCHVEMTEETIRLWLRAGAQEISSSARSPGVQSAEQIERRLGERVTALNGIANRLYERWSENLSRGS